MNNKLIYDNGSERFCIDFSSDPDKYQQILIAKSRGQTLNVHIKDKKDRVQTILSEHLFLIN